MTFKSKYGFGDMVVLKTDREKLERTVVQITFNPGSVPRYNLACGSNDSWHYEMEMTDPDNNNKRAGFSLTKV